MNDINDITTKEVKFIDDPKNLSALAKIHEISNQAKERRRRKSPNQINHMRVNENLIIDKTPEEGNFARRKSHFPTMKYPAFSNLFKPKDFILKNEGIRKSYKDKPGSKGYKSNFVWDKNNNRLVEKKIPLEGGLGKIEEKEEIEKKIEIKDSRPKKSEKGEILQKLKDYKKPKENSNSIEDNLEDDKNIVGSKNTKIYKKVVKEENGSKIIIKKVVEEITGGNQDDKLVFDDDSDDEEIPKEEMKYQITKEKFDPQGNKIYSKEILTNKLPKGNK